MERLRASLRPREYAPLRADGGAEDRGSVSYDGEEEEDDGRGAEYTIRSSPPTFSWLEYGVFVLLGVSMLWAWNMFLAAGPYLQQRFRPSGWIAANFQAAELSVSTVGTLSFTLLLTARMQRSASYTKRIFLALVTNAVAFTLLAGSTELFTQVSASSYFGFVIAMVFATSVATGLFQNGIFAYATGFGQPRYMQGIMVGQGIAGVLPCIAQIALVLAISPSRKDDQKKGGRDVPGSVPSTEPPPVPSAAAFGYFVTAVIISMATILAFSYLVKRKEIESLKAAIHSETIPGASTNRAAVPLLVLGRKLFWPALTIFSVFAVTMIFPVFTQQIVSVTPVDRAPRILYPSAFIPLAFLFWNTGDLLGRILTAFPRLSLRHRPVLLFVLALGRLLWIPLYYLCNIGNRGAKVPNDAFYLIVVQLGFGISGGYIGSSCMVGAADWVAPEEREASGGFMGMCLVFGLAVGSLLSFLISGT